MEKIEDRNRRSVIRWTLLGAAGMALAACNNIIPPGQIIRQTTPAATGTAPGQAKKKQ